MNVKRIRVPDFIARKQQGQKIAMLDGVRRDDGAAARSAPASTCSWSATRSAWSSSATTHAAGHARRDGPSHARRRRGTERALVVADMPFLTYQVSVAEAVRNAGRLLQEGGAAAVKLEGGRPSLDVVRRLVDVGIPVMGHLGLQPQSVHQLGGYRGRATQPREARRAARRRASRSRRPAPSQSCSSRSRPTSRAAVTRARRRSRRSASAPGPDCDGQVLVSYDMLGLFDGPVPSFVRQYAKLGDSVVSAVRQYRRGRALGRPPPRDTVGAALPTSGT